MPAHGPMPHTNIQPLPPMKTQHVILAIGTVMLFACNSAPKEPEPAAAPPTTTVAPVDTVINRYERKEDAQISRDTTKVAADSSEVKVP